MATITRQATKNEIWRLWEEWPKRPYYDDISEAAFNFHGYLAYIGASIIQHGNFPRGSICSTVRTWLEEYEANIQSRKLA